MKKRSFLLSLWIVLVTLGCQERASDSTQPDTEQEEINKDSPSQKDSSAHISIVKKKASGFTSEIEEETSLPKQTVSSNELTVEENFSFAELYKELDKKPEHFPIQTDRDTVIETTSGTRFSIPANGFVTLQGKQVGTVVLEIKDYFDQSDFVLANLTTTSHQKMLESGGMLHVKALSEEGKECKLKAGKTLEIDVPQKGKSYPDMELFFGQHDEAGQLNWNQSAQKKAISTKSLSTFSRLTTTMIQEQPHVLQTRFSIKELGTGNVIYSRNDTSELAPLIRASKEKVDSLCAEVVMLSDGTLKQAKLKKGNGIKKTHKVSFYYTKPRYMSTSMFKVIYDEKVNYTKRTYTVDIKGIASAFHRFDLSPHYFVNSSYPKKDKTSEYLITMYSEYAAKDMIASQLRNKPNIKDITEKVENGTANAADMSYYSFSTAQLNWINIDRFYHQSGEKVDMWVSNENKNMDVKLVFDNIKAVLAPEIGSKRFSKIPIDEPVTLVAIKMEKKVPFVAIKKLKTFDGQVNDLEFEKTTVEQLRSKLTQL